MQELVASSSSESASSQRVNRIPRSTYRLQLGNELNLDQVHALLPYLERLGISDLYLSPLFRSRAESSHGYDAVDHGTIDPDIGNLAAFQRLTEAAREAGMGILLDVVPNHMGINDPANVWWNDVLENGEGSYFADFFDIDWDPTASALQDKVLLPFLGESFGTVLERGELKVVYDQQRFQLAYWDRRFPLAYPSWGDILELAAAEQEAIDASDTPGSFADWAELHSVITQLRNLPPGSESDADAMEERYREQQVARRRLGNLIKASPAINATVNAALTTLNGHTDDARSFDRLEKLLEQQWYRLAYWRVAADEINYRRFFDINDLAAIRVENPRVFDAVHRLVGQFLGEGWVTGMRIDHPDGLRDPQTYFKKLHALYRAQVLRGSPDPDVLRGSPDPAESTSGSEVGPASRAGLVPLGSRHLLTNEASEIYIVAEKILSGEEPLRDDWAVCGTTGYDLLNQLGRLQIDGEGLAELREFYDRVTENTSRPADIVYESKRTVLFSSMSSELQMLAGMLYRIAQKHRASRDFTRPALQRALREVIACMTVYRTYVRNDSWEVSEADYRTVSTAVRMAKRRNRTQPASVFDFIQSVLLLEHPPTVTDEQAAERREFALKLQQVSGPVAAKGVEDTAFYRYYPLASLNEVGGELDAKMLSVDEFHRQMRHRCDSWPHSLSATATHDAKRGEDMRARLHVLSETPSEWAEAFERWREMNAPLRREIDGDTVPDPNEAYLLYQTLVGTWPLEPMTPAAREQYRDRIWQAMEKSLREAKLHTSWMNPSENYETAIREFVGHLLSDKGQEFMADMTAFVARIADAGFVNSLAQVLLKMTLPGVPDIYQGCELWDFSLVDPDNRRPVDFESRRERLNTLLQTAEKQPTATALSLSQRWPDADIKLWITTRCLALRNDWADVFTFGDYIPLATTGAAADHVVAFARRHEDRTAITVVPRHFYQLQRRQGHSPNSPQTDWGDSQIILPDDPAHSWYNHFTGQSLETKPYSDDASDNGSQQSLDIATLFDIFPVALFTSQP